MNTLCKPATQKRQNLLSSFSRVFKLKCTTSRLQWRSSPSSEKDSCLISSRSGLLRRNNATFGQTQRRDFHSTSKNKDKKARPDPFARRPTAKCDPYGQGGKPLPLWEANALLATLDPRWKIEEEAAATKPTTDNEENASLPPQELTREFIHPDFISGSKFVAKIAAVAQLNIHYPSIQLERRIVPKKKEWQVITQVRCHTLVLGGLSSHDFHLAMVSSLSFSLRSLKRHYLLQKSSSHIFSLCYSAY